ncbi:hypothetical protein HOLleu_42237 [Holothuria leucospilota]|uniref:Uncharacterized protein n=1 Tax=Holothuria leucospilota TaxID=206669 RepID=A0A9Q0YF28_HOLLE|nr:hypothetical protein HOLleu_42237 [Holothuria leucospilota]
MDKTRYVAEAIRQLSDRGYFTLDRDPTVNMITKLLTESRTYMLTDVLVTLH